MMLLLDNLHDWVVMDEYNLFRKDKQGKKGRGVAIHTKGRTHALRHSTKGEVGLLKASGLKGRGESSRGDITVVTCYSQPNQEKEVDAAFFKHNFPKMQDLVLIGDSNYYYICWKETWQSNKFLGCVRGKILVQVVEKPTREEAHLNLLLTNRRICLSIEVTLMIAPMK